MTEKSPFTGIDPSRLIHPAGTIAAHVKRIGDAVYQGVERRSEPRCVVFSPVLVQSLGDDLQLQGEPFWITMRDVSTRGAGLLHTQPVKAKRLALQLPIAGDTSRQSLLAVFEVSRCTLTAAGMWSIGGTFVTAAPHRS